MNSAVSVGLAHDLAQCSLTTTCCSDRAHCCYVHSAEVLSCHNKITKNAVCFSNSSQLETMSTILPHVPRICASTGVTSIRQCLPKNKGSMLSLCCRMRRALESTCQLLGDDKSDAAITYGQALLQAEVLSPHNTGERPAEHHLSTKTGKERAKLYLFIHSNKVVCCFRVRRALENTCQPLGDDKTDAALTYGQGLLQVCPCPSSCKPMLTQLLAPCSHR